MKSLCALALVIIGSNSSLAQTAGEPIGPMVKQRPACYAVNEPMFEATHPNQKASRLWNAAKRDGFKVGAEAISERPDISGAQMYIMYDPKGHMFGEIASVIDDGLPVQCNLGVGTEMKLIPMRMADIFEDALSVNKLTKLCLPLAERLKALEHKLGEVPIGRGSRGPNYDIVFTMSENGSWSELLIDKRSSGSSDTREISCFQNWGKGMLLNTSMRGATPAQ